MCRGFNWGIQGRGTKPLQRSNSKKGQVEEMMDQLVWFFSLGCLNLDYRSKGTRIEERNWIQIVKELTYSICSGVGILFY